MAQPEEEVNGNVDKNENDNTNNDNEDTNHEPNGTVGASSSIKNENSDKNIHVPKDRNLKIESVKVKEAISDNDIIYYDIHVKTVENRWITRKRFSEFEDLHNMLLKIKSSSSLPVLPPKHYKFWTDHSDPKFIEQRRALLDNYVRRLIKLKDVSTLQPVVNFFHDSKAIHITNDIIDLDQTQKNKSKNNDNDNDNNEEDNENANDKKDNNNSNDNNNDNNDTDTKEENGVKKSSYDEQVSKLITDSLSPNAKIVIKYDDNYKFPDDQEITHIEIQSMRKMSDHVLYQILVKNIHREEPYDKWTVMKRYHSIYEMDNEIRASLTNDNLLNVVKEMPLMPEKKSKLIHDHMSDTFMEGRQVLLQNYFNKLLRLEDVAKNKAFLTFFGVEVGDD